MSTESIALTDGERAELQRRVRSRKGRAEEGRIARVLLMLADGATYQQTTERIGCCRPFISKWKKRFLEQRLAGLYTRHQGQPATALTPKMEARILAATNKTPNDGSTHWSTRRLANKLRVHHMMVVRTWRKHGIQPHRMERYMASNDPDFETKAADIIGLRARSDPPRRLYLGA